MTSSPPSFLLLAPPQMFGRLDSSGDGSVDYREFVAWYLDVDMVVPALEAVPHDTMPEDDAAFLDAPASTKLGKHLEKMFKKVKPGPAGPGRARAKIPKKKQATQATQLLATEEETKVRRVALCDGMMACPARVGAHVCWARRSLKLMSGKKPKP